LINPILNNKQLSTTTKTFLMTHSIDFTHIIRNYTRTSLLLITQQYPLR